jgi:hypothetical protein
MRGRVVAVPVAMNQGVPTPATGLGDLAVADPTTTPNRQAAVDFAGFGVEDASERLAADPNSPLLTQPGHRNPSKIGAWASLNLPVPAGKAG